LLSYRLGHEIDTLLLRQHSIVMVVRLSLAIDYICQHSTKV
jgi:hypothetical protein